MSKTCGNCFMYETTACLSNMRFRSDHACFEFKQKETKMKLRTYRFRCADTECDFEDSILFDLNEEDSDAVLDCPECGQNSYSKTLHISAHGANTSKTSQSIPDGVRKFENKRAQRKLENVIRHAKKRGDSDTIRQAAKEGVDRGMLVKGVEANEVTKKAIKGKKK